MRAVCTSVSQESLSACPAWSQQSANHVPLWQWCLPQTRARGGSDDRGARLHRPCDDSLNELTNPDPGSTNTHTGPGPRGRDTDLSLRLIQPQPFSQAPVEHRAPLPSPPRAMRKNLIFKVCLSFVRCLFFCLAASSAVASWAPCTRQTFPGLLTRPVPCATEKLYGKSRAGWMMNTLKASVHFQCRFYMYLFILHFLLLSLSIVCFVLVLVLLVCSASAKIK